MNGKINLPSIKGVDVDAASIPEAEGLPFYSGPMPPATVYRVRLRRMYLTANKTHDDLWRVSWVATIAEKHPSRKKYNGYPLRDGQNYDETGVKYLNKMLTAMGLDKDSFHHGGIHTDDSDQNIIRVGDKSIEGLRFYVGTARRKAYDSGEMELAFARNGYDVDRAAWRLAIDSGR